MTSIVKSATLTALMIPAAAIAGLDIGQPLGATETDVRAALVDLGYEVQEIEIEDGEIEAEVTLNGIAYEVEVAVDTGLITEIELEDGDDDDEDDDNDS